MAASAVTRRAPPGGSASALTLLDETADHIRAHGLRLFSRYFLFSLPFALTGLLFLDSVSGGQSAMLPELCLGLVATGYLRWLGGSAVQRAVVAAPGGQAVPSWRKMLPVYLWLRFFWSPMFAGPIALDHTAGRPLAWLRRLKRDNRRFFLRYRLLCLLFIALISLQLFALHYFLVDLVLPYVLGFDHQLFRAVLYSRMWWMALFLILFLLYEFFNLVAGVLVYEALSNRWSGADLYRRLGAVCGEARPDGGAPAA